jgi:hypothetical protein
MLRLQFIRLQAMTAWKTRAMRAAANNSGRKSACHELQLMRLQLSVRPQLLRCAGNLFRIKGGTALMTTSLKSHRSLSKRVHVAPGSG